VTKSDLRPGLYPHPPNLAQEDTRDAQKAFWTIKHGIKMSAMPAAMFIETSLKACKRLLGYN